MCWALLLAGRSGVEAQAPAGCDSEGELLSNLEWLKRSCPHETFADGFTLVPRAITTAGCAEVARRVASECGWLLGSSDWFESRKAALDAAVVSRPQRCRMTRIRPQSTPSRIRASQPFTPAAQR